MIPPPSIEEYLSQADKKRDRSHSKSKSPEPRNASDMNNRSRLDLFQASVADTEMRKSDYSHLLLNNNSSPTPLRVRDDSDKSRQSLKQSPEIDSLNNQIDKMKQKAQY
mmetsp:Transcript_34995/g.53719  ORF Transcript_34995/g.53719 Transcript_34995/m.53719 type:complete len:109 (+) Transcript_34995:1463-1789(+)|eukprot:CAMPEP_0170499576 /NCGR_PEP_ID=MMETSP0208-20121228/31844_1 /TAXON_ID=197538 /ORGANISM="Strombidium inclinatum, Strain S3" /LENGTH=108 /DNA_ID=CAMNT_0010777187 /DNA_START=1394 /DNA_END=1720 /DNA_ORIENTATION=-